MSITFLSSLVGCLDTAGKSCQRKVIATHIRSDDINKFLWMVRIAQGVWPDEVQEVNYFTQRGEYAVDDRA